MTPGIFQFEPAGMRDILRRYKPDTVEELTALNAFYRRPGPMDMIDDFVERKWGRRKVESLAAGASKESWKRLSRRHRLSGTGDAHRQRHGQLHSLGEADLLRRAMGKKDPEAMASSAIAQQERRSVFGLSCGHHLKSRSDGEVLRLRLQQVALGRVCAGRVSNGLSQDAFIIRSGEFMARTPPQTSKPDNVALAHWQNAARWRFALSRPMASRFPARSSRQPDPRKERRSALVSLL